MRMAQANSGRSRVVLFWTVALVAAFFAAFVFPFLFPLKQAVFSPAYTVGGNNRVGAFAVAFVAVVTCAACLVWPDVLKGLRRPAHSKGLTRMHAAIAVCIVTSFSVALALLVVRSGTYYADSGYFVTQLRSGIVFHRALYRDVEFAYGPLLYLWPALAVRLLSHVGWSITAGYMTSFVALEAIGTLMLYWTVSMLPMSGRTRTVAFALLLLLTFDPQAGLNYTAFRFILPTFSLVLLARQHRVLLSGVTAFFAVLLNFAVSPELGVAFTAGAVCYGLYRALYTDKQWLLVSAAAVAGAGVFAAAMGRDYFRTMAEFAKGGYNEILEPAPHIYVLLACAVALAPMAVAAAIRDRQRADVHGQRRSAALLVGIFIAGLTLLAPALGRCDPLHVSFNGWALFLLACIAVDQMGTVGKTAWTLIAALFCVYTMGQEYALEKGPFTRILLHRRYEMETVDVHALEQVTRGRRIAFPMIQANTLVDKLTAMHMYQPEYLCIPAADAHAEERSVQEMREADFAMVSNLVPLVTENKVNNDGLRYHMRLDYKYAIRKAPFMQGAITAAELQQHWQPVGIYGGYTLYRKVS